VVVRVVGQGVKDRGMGSRLECRSSGGLRARIRNLRGRRQPRQLQPRLQEVDRELDQDQEQGQEEDQEQNQGQE